MRPMLMIPAAVLLVLFAAAAAVLLLPACGLRLPGGFLLNAACPVPARIAPAQADDGDALRREIATLERRLSQIECRAEAPPPPAAVPEPEPEPEPEDGLNRRAFAERDPSVIDGCWDLDSEYRVTNRRTGAVTEFSEWQICFSPDGTGTERMVGRRGQDRITCEGPLSRRFNEEGGLEIVEPRNLGCSNGSEIFRRIVTCTIDENNRADCRSRQPETGSNSPVRLRRAQGTP